MKVTTDTRALKELINDFDGSTEAAERLTEATKEVKTSFDAQRKAIAAYNSATRIQNFNLIQSLRLVRSTTSLFRNLNQVYQTLLLRQISTNQTTVAQSQAFDGLIKKSGNLVNALDILGPTSQDVVDGFNELIASADDISSEKIETLVENLERQASAAGLSAEEQKFFNDQLTILNALLDETKIEEQQKKFQDFFGTFTIAAAAASQVGLFVLQLKKLQSVQNAIAAAGKAGAGAGKGAPGAGAGAALGLLAIPGVLEALGFEKATVSPITGAPIKVVNPFEELEKIRGQLVRNEININNPTFNSNIDLEETIDIIQARLLEEQGKGTLE